MIKTATNSLARVVVFVGAAVAVVNLILDPSTTTGASACGWVLAVLLRQAYDIRTEQVRTLASELEYLGMEVHIDE